jgi:hypothetical protein
MAQMERFGKSMEFSKLTIDPAHDELQWKGGVETEDRGQRTEGGLPASGCCIIAQATLTNNIFCRSNPYYYGRLKKPITFSTRADAGCNRKNPSATGWRIKWRMCA